MNVTGSIPVVSDTTVGFPYPGLRPYNRDESDVFFGRSKHVTELLARLNEHRFLAVVGPSGCGKSSLIRAGLLPALEGGFLAGSRFKWSFCILRPGNQPMLRLAESLHTCGVFGENNHPDMPSVAQLNSDLHRGPRSLVELLQLSEPAQNTNLLILVDQFEELFRFESSGNAAADESRAFVNLLLETSRATDISAFVVITMRTDFLGQCPVFQGLPEAINGSQYLTPRLNREELRAAIEGPARWFGGDVEAAVVTRILNETGTDPDQLPRMQHLLMRMWRTVMNKAAKALAGIEMQSDESHPQSVKPDDEMSAIGPLVLTEADYDHEGGFANALQQHAEKVYNQRLTSDRLRRVAELMFRSLTDISSDGQMIRRSPVPTLAELRTATGASDNDIRNVIDVFRARGRSFLMPSPQETPDLVDSTPVDISHESLIRQWTRLRNWTKDEAESAGVQEELTQTAEEWDQSGRSDPTLPTVKLDRFIDWSQRHSRRCTELHREFLQACRQHRAANKRRAEMARRASFFLGFGSVAFALAILAIYFWSRSAKQVVKEKESMRTLQLRNAAQAWRDDDVSSSLHWLAKSIDDDVGHDHIDRLRFAAAIGQYPKLQTSALVPDAVAAEFRPKTSEVWIALAKPLPPAPTLENGGQPIASPFQIRFMRTGPHDTLLNADSLTTLPLETPHRITCLAWSLDGNTLAVANENLAAPSAVGSRGVPRTTALKSSTLRLWDVKRNALRATLQFDEGIVRKVAFAPDSANWGAVLLQPADSPESVVGDAYLWRDNGERNRLKRSFVSAVAFGSQRLLILSAKDDKQTDEFEIECWNVGDATQPHLVGATESAHQKLINCLHVCPERNPLRLVSASKDATAKVWTLTEPRNDDWTFHQDTSPLQHSGEIFDARFSENGRRIVTASRDQTLRIWDAMTGRPIGATVNHGRTVGCASFDPTDNASQRVVMLSEDIVRVWRFDTAAAEGLSFSQPGKLHFDGHNVIANSRTESFVTDWRAMRSSNVKFEMAIEPPILGCFALSPHREILLFARETNCEQDQRRSCRWEVLLADARRPASRVLESDVPIHQMVWNTNGTLVALAAGERQSTCGALRIYEFSQGQFSPLSFAEMRHVPNGREGNVQSKFGNAIITASFSPDGKLVASGGEDDVARIWLAEDCAAGRRGDPFSPFLRHSADVAHIAFSKSKYVATCSYDKRCQLWELEALQTATKGKQTSVSPKDTFHHEQVVTLAQFSADERFLVTVCPRAINVWHVATGEHVARFAIPDEVLALEIADSAHEHPLQLTALLVSPDRCKAWRQTWPFPYVTQSPKELERQAKWLSARELSERNSVLLSIEPRELVRLWQPFKE